MSWYKNTQIIALITLWSLVIGLGPAAPYLNVVAHNTATVATIYPPIEFSDDTTKEWRSIERYLTSTQYKTYIFEWSGFGGDIDLGEELIRSIQRAQGQGKIIIFHLVGGSYSMSALVICYANKIENPTNQFVMLHADAYVKNKKDIRVKKERTRIDEHINQCMKIKLISQKNIDYMWQGYELYVNNTERWYRADPRPLED